MSPADRLRLFVLCFWLLACVVNCETPQRGYVQHIQAGHSPKGVHNDDRGYERWSEPPIYRIPTAGYKTLSVDRGQSGNIYPDPEDHTTDSKSSYIQSRSPHPVIPETQKGKVNHFKSGFNSGSGTQRQSAVVNNHSSNKAVTVPDGKWIHQAGSDSVFTTGEVQAPSHIYRPRTKSKGSFSSIQVDKAPAGVGPNNRKGLIYSHSSRGSPNIQNIRSSLKSESQKIHVNPRHRPNMHPPHLGKLHLTRPEVSGYHSAYIFPRCFNCNRTNLLPKVLQPINKRTDSNMKGHFPGSSSAGDIKTQMSHRAWSPRAYNSDVTSEARGYAHTRRLKPGFDKTRPQASSTAGRKFLETGFPSENQKQGIYSHDSPKLELGLGVPTSSERQLNPNHSHRGSQPSRPQISVQGKFKPFQRLPPNNDLSADTHSSESEMAPNQTFSMTNLPASLNSTNITSAVVPSASGQLSTNSSSPAQTEGEGAEPLPQPSNLEGQSDGSAKAGPSSNENK